MTGTTIKQTDRDAALVDQLRYTHEWGIFQAQEDAMLPSFEECADRIEALSADVERLRGALSNLINAYTANVDTYRLGGFYTDPETEDEVIEARAALEATK